MSKFTIMPIKSSRSGGKRRRGGARWSTSDVVNTGKTIYNTAKSARDAVKSVTDAIGIKPSNLVGGPIGTALGWIGLGKRKGKKKSGHRRVGHKYSPSGPGFNYDSFLVPMKGQGKRKKGFSPGG